MRRASPPPGRRMKSWFWFAAVAGALRFDANTMNRPSRDHCGPVSLCSFVKVSCREEATPSVRDTRWMSDWSRALSQSGVVMVYTSNLPSGLTASDPDDFMSCTSMKVTLRVAACAAAAAAKLRLTTSVAAIRLNRVHVGNNGERCMGVLADKGKEGAEERCRHHMRGTSALQ